MGSPLFLIIYMIVAITLAREDLIRGAQSLSRSSLERPKTVRKRANAPENAPAEWPPWTRAHDAKNILLYQIKRCSKQKKEIIQEALIDVVNMLDEANERISELTSYLAVDRVPPIKDEGDNQLVSAYRMYESLIYRDLPTRDVKSARKDSIQSVRDMATLARTMSENIKNPASSANRRMEIYCDSEWLTRDNIPEDRPDLLWDNRKSIPDSVTWRHGVEAVDGLRHFDHQVWLQRVPAMINRDLAGPRTTVVTLNPRMLENDWLRNYQHQDDAPRFGELPLVNFEEFPKLPENFVGLSEMYLAPNLLMSFTLTSKMTGRPPMFGEECIEEESPKLWRCLVDLALEGPPTTEENRASFVYLVLGLYLSSERFDWSLGTQRPIEEARDIPRGRPGIRPENPLGVERPSPPAPRPHQRTYSSVSGRRNPLRPPTYLPNLFHISEDPTDTDQTTGDRPEEIDSGLRTPTQADVGPISPVSPTRFEFPGSQDDSPLSPVSPIVPDFPAPPGSNRPPTRRGGRQTRPDPPSSALSEFGAPLDLTRYFRDGDGNIEQ